MPDPGPGHIAPHPDLAGSVLGVLEPAESARFDDHLRSCRRCQDEVAGLAWLPDRLAQVLPQAFPPSDLQARTLAAVAQEARPSRPGAARLPRVAIGATAVLALAAVLGVAALSGSPSSEARALREVRLTTVGDSTARGTARLQRGPLGIVVELDLEGLAPTTAGSYYECWYVAAGDSPDRPARVSAGTFSAPASGQVFARMVTAADPDRYPSIEVTLEPDDGDPGRGGPAVLRATRRRN